jgi:predicted O-methyltransferase YrrM
VLRSGQEGAERLRLLARLMWPTTEDLLRQVGLVAGLRCLDVGCGIGAVTLEMARAVGPKGRAAGIDADERALQLARADAERLSIAAEFRSGSAVELSEDSAYDLVFARFLLSHVPQSDEAARRLVRAVVAGGTVAVEDTDFTGHFCYPDCPAFRRYVELYREVVRERGGDACIGPRLPGLLEEAGLRMVQMGVVQPAFREGEGKFLAAVTMQHVRDAVISAGLASPKEVDAIVAQLEEFARDLRTIVSLSRVVQVWGRRAS